MFALGEMFFEGMVGVEKVVSGVVTWWNVLCGQGSSCKGCLRCWCQVK